ncbi:MAG: zinc ribbon domain-containing protein [Burkholderiales bacterium]|nr:zinc ribbon domain-containing protein [Burkholderiales bacterium]
MPIYDYKCLDCNAIFDKLVMGATKVSCPQCNSENLEKLVSKPAPRSFTAEIVSGARKQAAKEGHFSNYKSSEKPKT